MLMIAPAQHFGRRYLTTLNFRSTLVPWYVIHSKPNKEELLYEQLCIRKVDAYYPSIKVHPKNPHARKRKPYFPGYLFVNADLGAIGLATLRWMPGAIGLVDFGGQPASIPDEMLQTIRRNVDRANGIAERKHTKFKPGDRVTIQSGPLAGYRAIFDSRLPGRERVRVLMQMLWDRQVNVELSVGQIELLEKHQSR
jgi:transcriptional antiterminator RfaH